MVRLLGTLAVVASVVASTPLEGFREAFDQYVRDDGIVGAAYVLVRDGRPSDWHSVGMADREAKQPVNENTIFHWGSITKTLTAVSIMQLRDRGRLSLEDPVVKYVPELLRIHSDYGPVSSITIRQLLSHTAGFQSATWPYRDAHKTWQPFEPTEWGQLVAMMPYQELLFVPGTKFSYSNPGFIYLARVMEAVTGDPYQVYVQKNLLTPLGMTRSYFNLTPYALAKDRSNNYTISIGPDGEERVIANGRDFDTGITTPNGGLNAPLGDLVKWVAFLAATTPEAESILSRESLREMWKPVVTMGTDAERPESMGLSFVLDSRGHGNDVVTFVGHTGSQAAFRAFFELNPQTGRAVIAAFNTAVSYEPGVPPADRQRARASGSALSALRERALQLLR